MGGGFAAYAVVLFALLVFVHVPNRVNLIADGLTVILLGIGFFFRYPWAYLGNAWRNAFAIVTVLYCAALVVRDWPASSWCDTTVFNLIGVCIELAVATQIAVKPLLARRNAVKPVSASMPMRGSVTVVSGGSNTATNHHAKYDEYRYALDIVLTDSGGRRGKWPTSLDLSNYFVYGAPVLSPVDGIVVAAHDGLEDQVPGQRDGQPPAGNFLEIETNYGNIVLAHLRMNSLLVQVGEHVTSGQRVASVGNSGNTTEPQLHLHALQNGVSVPILLNGKFLVRNDIIHA